MGYFSAKAHPGDTDMSDHKHGEMDTTEHEKTFDWFMWFISRGAVAIIVLLIFLALVNG